MRAYRIVPVAAFLGTALAIVGCGKEAGPSAPSNVSTESKGELDPATVKRPQPPPTRPKDETPDRLPPPILKPEPDPIPVSAADKMRLEVAEKAGAAVYEAQNGGYEIRIEPAQDTDAILTGLKGTKCVVGLSLEGTKATDAGLKNLDGFDYLERLALHQCPNVTGSGFTVLPRLSRLKSLVLSECPISDDACAFVGRARSLEEVRFVRTKVTDAGLRELAGLAAMESLGLEGTQVTGSGFTTPGWAKLRDLDAPRSAISDMGLDAVAALPVLERLQLDSTKVTDAGLVHLKEAKKLAELYLSETRITDTGMRSLAGLEKLRVLDVSKTATQGLGFDLLPNSLRKLTLDGSKFHDNGAVHLARFTELTALSATDCPVSDTGLTSLKDLKRLTKVNLAGTKASDVAATLLGTLPALEVATFDRTGLSDKGLRELIRAPKLRFVEARNTKVTKQGAAEAVRFGPPGLRVDAE